MYEPNLEEVIASLIGVTLAEDEVRSIVGAPSIEESKTCACGDKLKECKDSYEHALKNPNLRAASENPEA